MSEEVRKGYKRTEVGVVPEEWEATTIGEVASFSGGSQPPRSTFKFASANGYVRLIQIRDYKTDDFITFIPELLARKRCTRDDIMIGRYGPPIFQILRGLDGAYNVALIKATPSAKIEREYFFNVLRQDCLFQLIESLSRRSSGQTGVEMPSLKAYGLPLPPLPEQRLIASALSDVDSLIASLEKFIVKKRDIKQAAMQELLTGKKRLPGFKGEWEEKRLGECLLSRPEYGINAAAVPYSDKLPSYIRITDITEYGRYCPDPHVSVKAVNADHFYLQKGDLVFARTGASVGKSYLYDTKDGQLVFAGFLIRVCPNPEILVPAYLSAFVTTKPYWDWVRLMSMRSGQPGINGNEYAQLPLLLPAVAEQTAIASLLSDMDSDFSSLEQRLAKTRALKQGMMQELLTGKTRLNHG